MIFVSEWEQDSCIIHGEEWLCLSITVREQRGSIAALIEPHRATLCLSTPPKAINPQTQARTKYSLVTYSYSKAAFESNKRTELSLTGTLQWICDILCEAWTIVIIFHYFMSKELFSLLLSGSSGNLYEQLDYLTKIIVLWFIKNGLNVKLWKKYKRCLWFHKYSNQNSTMKFFYNDTKVSKIFVFGQHSD